LATNYTLLTGSRTAAISAAPLTVTTSNVIKTYDGGLSVASAGVAPTPIVKAGSSTQLFGSDSLSGGSYAYTNAGAGSGNRSVTVAGVTVNDGNNGLNYAVTYASNTTSTINPKALTVSALSQTKVYDATTAVNSSALGTGYSVIGLVGSETVSGATLVYANADVSRNSSGTVLSDKTIVVSGAVAGANTQLSNYTISYVNNTSSTITPKPVSLSAVKVYDGSADLTGWVAVNTGIVGQVLSYSGARANSAEAGVIGNYISQIVLVSTPTSSASNYILPVLNASTAPVSISIPQPAVVTITKTYEDLPVVNSPTPALALTSPVVVATPAPSPSSTGSISTSPDTSGRGFISVDPINPPVLDAGTVFKLTVPQTAFRHMRSDARITLSAASPGGSALPAWATFDATRNILSGTAPDGVVQLDVEVTAVDEDGYRISIILNLKFSKKP
jgi:hypothetical protein